MNELTKLLDDIATGQIPVIYRKAIQQLLIYEGQPLLRATYYVDLLNQPDEYPHPVQAAMRDLGVSRPTIFRDYKEYKFLRKKI